MTKTTEFAERRERVLDAMAEGVAVFAAAPLAIRNNDVEHAYRQDSDFYYLTGFEEPESVLLLTKAHAEHRVVLFVRPKNPERELWDGSRAGVEGAVSELGADAAYPIEELPTRLAEYLGSAQQLFYQLGVERAFDDTIISCLSNLRRGARRGVSAPARIVDPSSVVHEMRLKKSTSELKSMRKAAAITGQAHSRAMRFANPGRFEYEVEAELLHTFRQHGSERTAYDSIVGSGPNATVLHYRNNNRKMQDGDLLLIDAGCEFEYYASDVTRTFPVNGRFSSPQRALYEIVLQAQLDAIAAVKPGATIQIVHDKAVETLVAGLVDEGLLQGDPSALIEETKYANFYMHRTSHWLGMDVHDVGRYTDDSGDRPLEPGFVLTVEPGLYIAANADVDPKWQGIGIRIEDDIVVTDNGSENLTEAIPKTVGEVEAACAG